MRPSEGPPVPAECAREPRHAYEALAAVMRAAEDALIERVVAAVREVLAGAPTAPAAEPVAERLLTAEQAAARIAVDLRTFRRLEKQGQVPRGLRIGKRIVRWHPAVIDAWAKSGVVPPPPLELEPVPVAPRRRGKKNVFALAREVARP
jgi:predicted DNA-binding transcriptional regulator AlpA